MSTDLPTVEPRPDLYDAGERMSLDELREVQLTRLRWSVGHAYERVAALPLGPRRRRVPPR